MADNKLNGLNEVREVLYDLYPNAKTITVVVSGEKIKITPNEEYSIPVGGQSEEEE